MNSFYCSYCFLYKQCPKIQDCEKIHTRELSEEFVGMKNEYSEQNCFANSALQALLSIKSFCYEMEESPPLNLDDSLTKNMGLLIRAVNQVKLSRMTDGVINISIIRMILRQYNSMNFEIGEQADSMEALQAFLAIFHNEQEIFNPQNGELCNCIVHRHFGMLVKKIKSCLCGEIFESLENICCYNLFVSDLFNTISFKYKAEVVLKPSISSKSMEQQSLNEYIKKELYKTNNATCDTCKMEKTTVNQLLRIPTVYTIQLIWPNHSPNLLKILQFLKSMPNSIDLSTIYSINRSTNHVLTGMIVHLTKHYVYFTKSKENKWHIINDSFSKQIVNGELFDIIEQMLVFGAYPVGLFYQEDSSMNTQSSIMDNESWLLFEKKIFSREIYPLFKLKPNLEEWTCIYCYDNNRENKHSSNRCNSCGRDRIYTLSEWKCKDCNFINSEQTMTCDKCCLIRFYIYLSQTKLLCGCPKGKIIGRCCEKHGKLDKCTICNINLYRGQTLMCFECGSAIVDHKCECELFPTIVCKFCFDKLQKCIQCGNWNLKTNNKCKSCSFQSDKRACKKCSVINDLEICFNCQALDQVKCFSCKRKIELAVCYICPICDGEIIDEYCANCDYKIDYSRFLCGGCRKSAKRCPICTLGLIESNDINCHLCYTRTETFALIKT